jgi:hypothetical protein
MFLSPKGIEREEFAVDRGKHFIVHYLTKKMISVFCTNSNKTHSRFAVITGR